MYTLQCVTGNMNRQHWNFMRDRPEPTSSIPTVAINIDQRLEIINVRLNCRFTPNAFFYLILWLIWCHLKGPHLPAINQKDWDKNNTSFFYVSFSIIVPQDKTWKQQVLKICEMLQAKISLHLHKFSSVHGKFKFGFLELWIFSICSWLN